MADTAKRILVIDDDPDARAFLTTVAEDNGWATRSAKDGVEGLALVEEELPDLVALDITMPEKSGVAVYRALKENPRTSGIPVLIITGMSDDFERFISTRRQVPPPEGYISKPVEPEKFVEMVRKLLG